MNAVTLNKVNNILIVELINSLSKKDGELLDKLSLRVNLYNFKLYEVPS